MILIAINSKTVHNPASYFSSDARREGSFSVEQCRFWQQLVLLHGLYVLYYIPQLHWGQQLLCAISREKEQLWQKTTEQVHVTSWTTTPADGN